MELAEQVAETADITGRGAVVRAGQALGLDRSKTQKRFKLSLSRSAWGKKRGSVAQKHLGGRPGVVGNPALTRIMRKFLVNYSKEMSRFCCTKPRHVQALNRSPI